MFTGIVEAPGTLALFEDEGSNRHFWFSCPFTHELKIDQSVSHNGVCLTVVEILNDRYKVTAIRETLQRTNLGSLQTGDRVNLERCMPATGRFDGHIVQGHVDGTATVKKVADENGSWNFYFTLDQDAQGLIVPKGSICLNGVSLTLVEADGRDFSVSIIPYTFEHTNFHRLQPGSVVNVEFDILGKYVLAAMNRLHGSH